MVKFDGVYIGSRYDTTPIKYLSIKSWIYIDALPNMNAGFKEDEYSKKSDYLDDVIEEFKKIDFVLQEHNAKEQMMLFKHNTRHVIYFYNVIFPNCSPLQLKLLKHVSNIYICAFDPDRKILNMIHKTIPITIYIFHVALYYKWDKKNKYSINFETDHNLTTYLLFEYIENIKYIWLKNEGRDNIEKVKVNNLLEYHYLETKQSKHHFKSLKDVPSL